MRAGKVIYPAVSNWSAWQTQRAVDIQERNNWARLQVIQPMYSLVKRQAEVEILPMAEPTASASFPTARPPPGCSRASISARPSGRLKTNKMYEARYGDEWMFEVAEKYVAFCKQQGPASGQHGDRLGGRASGDHRAHHRRAQSRPAQGFAGRRSKST